MKDYLKAFTYLAQEYAFDLVILTLIIFHHTIATKSSHN